MRIAFLILAGFISLAFTYNLSKEYQHFPTQLELHYSKVDSEVLTVYFDIGAGFRQSLRGLSEFTEQGKVSIELPKKTVNKIRLDLDSEDNLRQSIFISQLCLTRKNKKVCWSSKDLNQNFIEMNAISEHSIIGKDLFIEAGGHDPHFSFSIDTSEAHTKISKISKVYFGLFALLLLVLVFLSICLAWFVIFPYLWKAFLSQKKHSFKMPLHVAVACVTLFSLAISGVWLIAYQAGALTWMILFGGVALIALLPSQQSVNLSQLIAIRKTQLFFNDHGFNNLKALLFILIICIAPTVFFLSSTWVQEFPHLGDHEYHLWGNRVAYTAIKYNLGNFLCSALLVLIGLLIGQLRIMVVLATLLLVSTGIWNISPGQIESDIQGIFSRYPGGSRILASPFVHMSYEFNWNDPLNTGRIVNVLSVPIWLLILRPLIIGRLPSLSLLPFVFVFFWQAEMVYHFSSAYLDIWSVVFVLLAIEKLIVSQTDPDSIESNGYLKACLLLSIACAFKEPAVFLIPWFWLAGWSLNSIREIRPNNIFQKLYHPCVIGFASVLPFLVYYAARKSFGVSRYTVRGFDYFLTPDWFAEMGNRISFHFGMTGLVMLIIISALWAVILILPAWKSQRWMMLCILGAFITQIFLFNWDQGGVSFTGYYRFYLPAIALFFSPLLLIASTSFSLPSNKTKFVIGLSLLAFLGNSPSLYASLSQLNQPDSIRNFNEHYDAPIYLPIRSLIKTAEKAGVLEGDNREIYINHVTSWNQPAFVYADLLVKYKLRMEKDLKCSCSSSNPTVLAPYVYFSGLNEHLEQQSIEQIKRIPQHQAKYVSRWREVNYSHQQCVAEIDRTCQYVAKEKLSDGTIIGAIGVGVN